jgi:hypothetical protein
LGIGAGIASGFLSGAAAGAAVVLPQQVSQQSFLWKQARRRSFSDGLQQSSQHFGFSQHFGLGGSQHFGFSQQQSFLWKQAFRRSRQLGLQQSSQQLAAATEACPHPPPQHPPSARLRAVQTTRASTLSAQYQILFMLV